MKKKAVLLLITLIMLVTFTSLLSCGLQDRDFVSQEPYVIDTVSVRFTGEGNITGNSAPDIAYVAHDSDGVMILDESVLTPGYEIFSSYQEPSEITDRMRQAYESAVFYLNADEDEQSPIAGISKLGLYRILCLAFTEEESLWAVMQYADTDWNTQALLNLTRTRDYLDDFDYETSPYGNERRFHQNMLLIAEFRATEINYVMNAVFPECRDK
jgi:hypothetical protein